MSNPLRGNDVNASRVAFRFFPADTSTASLTVHGGGGEVVSVARTSNVGEFLVTFVKGHYRCKSVRVDVQIATASDYIGQAGAISNLGTTTPTTALVRVQTAATPADIGPDANTSVSCEFIFEDSTIGAS